MRLLDTNINGFGLFVGAATFIVGVLSWWLAKLLSDKKEITTLQVKVENLEDKVKDIEAELKDNRKNSH